MAGTLAPGSLRRAEKTWGKSVPPGRPSVALIRGTIRAIINNLIGHFAQRLRKARAGVSTFQRSQIEAPGRPRSSYIDPGRRMGGVADGDPAGACRKTFTAR